MANSNKRQRRLWDAYTFPSVRPQHTVRGIFGDPKARVITLNRRSKKQSAAERSRAGTSGAAGARSAVWRHSHLPGGRGTCPWTNLSGFLQFLEDPLIVRAAAIHPLPSRQRAVGGEQGAAQQFCYNPQCCLGFPPLGPSSVALLTASGLLGHQPHGTAPCIYTLKRTYP